MRRPSFPLARHRLVLALPFALVLSLIAAPAVAGPPQAGVSADPHAAHAAKNAAPKHSDAAANARLLLLNSQITALKATIAADAATLKTVNAALAADQGHLAAYLRQSYMNGGSQALLAYIISANSIAAAIQRDVQVNEISTASGRLVARIGIEEAKAASTLAQDNAALKALASAQEQARTEEAVIKVQEQNLLLADVG